MKKQSLLLIFCLVLFQFVKSQENNNSSDDKTVTLTVTGQGKTIDAAKTNALRSAIEQAFGAFISSNTTILNDNLVKDEIVSVTNGNIQKYDIISEAKLPNDEYAITVNAVVSVTKLTSFCESKGVKIEIKGGLFSANIKQQILNEASEIIAVHNISETLTELAFKCFDFNLIAENPSSKQGDNSIWLLNTTTSVKPNSNLDLFVKYLYESLSSICMTVEEMQNYKNLKKDIYDIEFIKYNDLPSRIFYFRKKESFEAINSLIHQLIASSVSFKIKYEGLNRHFDAFWLYNRVFNDNEGISRVYGGLLPYKISEVNGINYDIRFAKDFDVEVYEDDFDESKKGHEYLLNIFRGRENHSGIAPKYILSFSNFKKENPYLKLINTIELKINEIEIIQSISVISTNFSASDYIAFDGRYCNVYSFILGPKRSDFDLSKNRKCLIQVTKINEMPALIFINSEATSPKYGMLAFKSKFLTEGSLKINKIIKSVNYDVMEASLKLPDNLFKSFTEMIWNNFDLRTIKDLLN